MKRILLLTMLCMAFFTSSLRVTAAEPKTEKPKTKVLIVTGGHEFDTPEFYKMFDEMPGIVYEKATLPKDMDRLAPGLEKQFDVTVSYDMNRFPITDEQRANFAKLIESGMPLVVFHHSIGGYENWPLYRDIAGGQYLEQPAEIDGKKVPASTYKHDIDMKITVADKNHPITKGVDDFTIHDEGYHNVFVKEGNHVLLTTDHPDGTKEVAWTHRYGKGPVFTIMLGHDKQSYANPALRKLLKQGVEWCKAERPHQ